MARILAIHAHPDDIETLGAGALALLASLGHAIRMVTATAGEGGRPRRRLKRPPRSVGARPPPRPP